MNKKTIVTAVLAGTAALFTLGVSSIAGAAEKPMVAKVSKPKLCLNFEVVGEDELLLCRDGKRPQVYAEYEILYTAKGTRVAALIFTPAKEAK